jgi:putative transposase
MGMILGVLVLPANFSDDFGAKRLLQRIPFTLNWLMFLFDGGYDKPPLIHWCEQLFGVRVQIAQRLGHGFQVIPKRWIVERTFAGLGHYRRLSKDYEASPQASETLIYMAMTRLMLKRLHPK